MPRGRGEHGDPRPFRSNTAKPQRRAGRMLARRIGLRFAQLTVPKNPKTAQRRPGSPKKAAKIGSSKHAWYARGDLSKVVEQAREEA